MTLAGFPTATLPSGISFVTTAPAPIVTRFPTLIPGKITAFAPIQQSSPMTIGFAYSFPREP
ncbi:hypothetical protein FIBSPDRAFT_863133 [Athelia psychrophila]|uniref:Uncharacterized protein n=1 Tax=Athelia psychrophila TaxID=1759441 RepID=A0A166HSP2_9AGAM|nr:hypothetical protein FIBSPDRAFT_863133 [Fibularhizoctonia sp. CBS 109695]